MRFIPKIIVVIVLLLILTSLATFTVDQREHAVVFRLGEIVSVKEEPGLYLKAPLVDNVKFSDALVEKQMTKKKKLTKGEKKDILAIPII